MMRRCLLFILCLHIPKCAPLAVSPKTEHPIKRVAIVGAGISGLSLAHALENSPELAANGGDKIEVTVFDSRPYLNYQTGAGVQINGGISALRKINPAVQKAVAEAALPLTKISSRTKTWFGADKPYDTLLELELEKIIKETGGLTEKELIVDGEVMCYAIMRGALQKVLVDTLPKETANRILFSKTVTGIRGSEKDGITCELEDGSEMGNFDMIVGCDGVNTAVKQYIEKGKITKGNKEASIYSGIRIRYAIQDGDPSKPALEKSEFRQYFGDGGYALAAQFGDGAGQPTPKAAYFIFLDEDYIGPFKKKEVRSTGGKVSENADWQIQGNDVAGDARADTIEIIKKRGIPDLEISPIVANADRFFELGVYFHNPFSLNGWSKEVPGADGRFCVLAGDAAHAMPPFLGQGANQAIQDSYCLAKQICRYNARLSGIQTSGVFGGEGTAVEHQKTDLKSLLKEYETQRWAATTSITAKAAFLGYLEAGSAGPVSKFRDVFFFAMGKLGVAKKVFLGAATPKF